MRRIIITLGIMVKGGLTLKEQYICYLNGKRYGNGDMEYMRELFIDYFVTCQMHGNEQGEFKVVSRKKLIKNIYNEIVDQYGNVLEELGRN